MSKGDALRPITLTAMEQELIAQEADQVISETLAVNELYVACGRQLPKSDWRHLKTKENFQVYRTRKERRARPQQQRTDHGNYTPNNTFARDPTSASYSGSLMSSRQFSYTSSNSSSSPNNLSPHSQQSVIAKMKPQNIPLVVATGVISGTVEDAAFGALAHTETLWRSRDAHLKDEYAAIKILAVIREPTAQDPFRSLVLKWSTKRIGSLARMRDCVFIEANGIAFDSKGVPFAYNLVHSIDNIARIPGLKHLDVVRVNISTCYISRRYNQSSIEVFCRGFVDPGVSFTEIVSNTVYPNMVLTFIDVVDCALMKKLVWLMHKKRNHSGSSHTLKSSSSRPANCTICSTKSSGICNLVRSWVPCQACQTVVCQKCTVVKKLQVEVSRSEMKEKAMTFCLHCMVEAKEASTRQVASESVNIA
uniref:FYVE-type domain-containing protein n=1 Tax=Globisporangium ultimum (strain ATCC 200006 / CBS 805.95 / DAOM BR144) TaxID=431595 RepID=K3WFW7_GLOUD